MGKDFLETIVGVKKEQLAAAMQATPVETLAKTAEKRNDFRPFEARFTPGGDTNKDEKHHISIIAEIKRASPSKGVIKQGADVAGLAAVYEKGGAEAISVLTETRFFKGSIKDLQDARKAQGLPVLRKDFIISRYQVYESAAIGADAILLIVRVLGENQLKTLMALAKDLGLDVLVEIHGEGELEIATSAGARLIGINNRNLASFDTDVTTAMKMSARLLPGQVPVAASGINTIDDIRASVKAGITSFLIGEALMCADNPELLLKQFITDALP